MIIKFVRLRIIICVISIVFILLLLIPTSRSVYTVSKKTQDNNINWVDFNIPYSALNDALEVDIEFYKKGKEINWIEILAYLGSIYGGNFNKYKKSDIIKLISEIESGNNISAITEKLKSYNYYFIVYNSVLKEFVGEYNIETDSVDKNGIKLTEKRYGLKVFSPIAKGYSYSHYDDFGNSRSYGFRRKHLGHDIMGSIGTPVVAVESGIVENVGWNQYGGWRIGIRSFDKRRYYYYAHLRKDHPFNDVYEGKVVKAGDVIGYLGMTGYSKTENVNNINVPHLHFGMELIFDEKMREEQYEIWIDLYAITKLLEKNKSEVYKANSEYYRKYDLFEENTIE